MNIIVGQYLAEELDVEGRVTPILWSMTDVVFRQAIADDVLPVFVENPDDKTIRDYARRLRVDYESRTDSSEALIKISMSHLMLNRLQPA